MLFSQPESTAKCSWIRDRNKEKKEKERWDEKDCDTKSCQQGREDWQKWDVCLLKRYIMQGRLAFCVLSVTHDYHHFRLPCAVLTLWRYIEDDKPKVQRLTVGLWRKNSRQYFALQSGTLHQDQKRAGLWILSLIWDVCPGCDAIYKAQCRCSYLGATWYREFT